MGLLLASQLMLTLSTAHTGMEASPTVAWLAILMPESLPTPPLTSAMPPDTECPMLPTALESPELPPLPSLLPPDCTPEPEDTLLTLLVSSMLPRGPLMLSPRPMLPICMEDTATVLSVVLTPMVWDTMFSLDTHMATPPSATPLTTERDPLMLSQRPMPTTVTTDTEPIPMLDMVTAPTDHTVWLTVMAEASTTKSLPKQSRTRENSRFIQRLLS